MYSPSTTFLLHFRSLFTNCNEDSILHTIQMSRIFPDSKTFVDMKLLHPPAKVEENFRQLTMVAGANPDASTLREFVEDNFSLENQMEDFEPADWKSHPKLISRIQDLNYALLAQDLNSRWKTLCRKIKEEVAEQPDRCKNFPQKIFFLIMHDFQVLFTLLTPPCHRTRRPLQRSLLLGQLLDHPWSPPMRNVRYSQRNVAQFRPFDPTIWKNPQWRSELLLESLPTSPLYSNGSPIRTTYRRYRMG